MLIERKRYALLKSSALKIEAWIIGFHEVRRLQTEFKTTRSAVITIQAWYRGLRDKRRYDRMRRSAILVQAQARMLRQRTQYRKMRAAIVLQRAYRLCVLARKDRTVFIHKKNAAIKIQAWW